jgi:hypothetical protein
VQILAFAGVVALFILRTPYAVRHRNARPAWIATGCAIIGLLTIGQIVPLDVADAPLGGTNLVMLARTIFPVLALWYMREAIKIQARSNRGPSSLWLLTVLIAAQILAFFLIPDRGITNVDFVNASVSSVAGMLWAVIYCAGVIWITVSSAILALPIFRSVFSAFVVGSLLIALGALSEAVHAVSLFSGWIGDTDTDAFSLGFTMFFYSGVLLVTVGFVINVAISALPRLIWRLRLWQLLSIQRHYPSESAGFGVAGTQRAFAADPDKAAYAALMAVRDKQLLEGVRISRRHLKTLNRLEEHLDKTMVISQFRDGGSS